MRTRWLGAVQTHSALSSGDGARLTVPCHGLDSAADPVCGLPLRNPDRSEQVEDVARLDLGNGEATDRRVRVALER